MPSVAISNPTLTAGCVCMLLAPSWCELGCCSQEVKVLKLRRIPAFTMIAVLSCVPGRASCIWRSYEPWRVLGSVCAEDHKNSGSGVEHRRVRKSSLQAVSRGSMSVQPDSDLLLAPWKRTSCYFQAISGFFLRSSGARRYGEPFTALQPAMPGAALLPLFNDMFAGAAAKPLWRASAAPTPPTNSSTVCSTHLHLSGPLQCLHLGARGPALLGRHWWCIDIHGNKSPTWILVSIWGKTET